MDIKEVLKLAEELIYDHTGENLNYLQKNYIATHFRRSDLQKKF